LGCDARRDERGVARHTSDSQRGSAPNPASKKFKLLTNEPLAIVHIVLGIRNRPAERANTDGVHVECLRMGWWLVVDIEPAPTPIQH